MTLAPLQRDKIYDAILAFRKNFDGSQRDYCKMMGINDSAYSQLKGGKRDNLISDDKLVRLGRKLQVNFSSAPTWKVVETEAFHYLTGQFEYCQQNNISRIFCDKADIGKSEAAKQYMLMGNNVFYLDCSQAKSRTEFIRSIAKMVGVGHTGSVKDVYRDTVYMLHSMETPLIILDEAGDLSYPAFLEIKSYWNALEGACAWYLMGADGLAKKIQANVDCKRVGYAEILRRFGDEYMTITGKMNAVEITQFLKRQILDIAVANLPEGVDLKDVTKNTLSLTRVKENIRKAVTMLNTEKKAA